MKLNKKVALACIGSLVAPIAMMAPAQAVTISETNCVLKVPATKVLTRADAYKLPPITFTESDLTCPDIANPFKTTDIEFVRNSGSWNLDQEIDGAYTGYGAAATYISENTLGAAYGAKRIELDLGIGSYRNADKSRLSFISTPGADATIGTDDDVYYPLTFSNSIVSKYRSDVSVKTKKSGNIIKLTVTVDRNLIDNRDSVSPRYVYENDKVTVYRDGKAIKTVKMNADGKVSFTVKDKKGKNNYSVVLPSTVYNFEGNATFVR